MRDLIQKAYRNTRWDNLHPVSDWIVEEGIRIQQIAAPTFDEADRAEYVASQFRALGLTDVMIDEYSSVIACMRSTNTRSPALLVSAHLDTVFDADTDLRIRRKHGIIYGPGLGDNSLGVSGMLGLIKFLKEEQFHPDCDIWFAATSCEEGLGDLRGIRAVFERLKQQIALVINLEGLAFGHIYNAGIAVHRLRISAQADGGHSWLHFGKPSAIHALIELSAQITHLKVPTSPRTTFNIGLISGGHAINAIATRADMWLDMRSENQQELERLRNHVQRLIRSQERPGVKFSVEVVGDRPAGEISPEHPLVVGAMTALELCHMRGVLQSGSTDGNIPLFAGCPTVTIGLTRGGNAHRLDEYIETTPIPEGLRQLVMLVIGCTYHLLAEKSHPAGG